MLFALLLSGILLSVWHAVLQFYSFLFATETSHPCLLESKGCPPHTPSVSTTKEDGRMDMHAIEHM